MIPGDRAQKSRVLARIRRRRWYDKLTPEDKQRRLDWQKCHPGYNTANVKRRQAWYRQVTKLSAHRDGMPIDAFDMQHLLRNDISCMAIALLIGRTYSAVIEYRRVLRHGRNLRRPQDQASSDKWRNAKRDLTNTVANRTGLPWSDAELRLVWQNPNGLSNTELALTLGRSYDSVCAMKYRRGLRPSRAIPGAKNAANKKMIRNHNAAGKRTPEQIERMRIARWGR